MKRWLAVVALVAIAAAVAVPAGASGKSKLNYGLAGEARALEIALGSQGLTLGVAASKIDSTPSAIGSAAGQCNVLGDEAQADSLPCNESTMQKSSFPDSPGKPGQQVCAGPAIPAPLSSVLKVDLACGASYSGLKGGFPFTMNEGKIAEASLTPDLGGVIPQVEDVKEQVVDQLQAILDQAPEPVQNALDQVLDSVDAGQAVQLILGPATSDITTEGGVLKVRSTAAGAKIGVLGIPDLNKDGLPILGSSEATEDGLLVIEVGASSAEASVNKLKATSDAAASAAIVTVKVRDITKLEPTYVEVSVAPGETVTVLEGTPLESTITAADSSTEVKGRSAVAAADAVRLHLLKGVQGGIVLGLGRSTAAANVAQVQAAVQEPQEREPTKVLPLTGGRDFAGLALVLMLGAAGLLVIRRKLSAR